MKNKELIEILQQLPLDAECAILYDGACRLDVNVVYLARGTHIVITDLREVVYYDTDRPVFAPSQNINPYWNTDELK